MSDQGMPIRWRHLGFNPWNELAALLREADVLRKAELLPEYLYPEQAAEFLGVTIAQFRKLKHNPTFPDSVEDQDRHWVYSLDEIAAFKIKMNALKQRGFKIPEALYPWPAFGGEGRGFCDYGEDRRR